MRIDAYNAVSQIYQSCSMSVAKKSEAYKSSNDKLEFSQTAKSYQTAKAAVRSAEDARADKVARIKAQMEAGTYYISSEMIADRILENAETLTF